MRNLEYTLRSLRRAPSFTIAVVFSLALGIGANCTMFTIINAVLLRALPYPQGGELLAVSGSKKGIVQDVVLEPYARAWSTSSRTLASVAIYKYSGATVSGSALPESVAGAAATDALFTVLRSRPAIGRSFDQRDLQSSSERVVILSDGLWRRHFAADSGIIGRVITLSDNPATVIGVMPPGREFPPHTQYWVPLKEPVPVAGQTAFFFVGVIARPANGATISSVQNELSQLARRTDEQLPAAIRGSTAVVSTLHDRLYGSARPALRILFAAVLLLLLIACANVANLVLARTVERQREFAVRVALGATRASLVRLVVLESLIVAIAGAATGLVLSNWATRVFVGLSPAGISTVANIGLDGRVLAFTALLAVASALLVGIGPAFRAARRDPRASLGEGGARGGTGRPAMRVRRALVAAQLAIAVVLLAGAGLLIQSLARLTNVDLGFRPDHVLTADINLPYSRYASSTLAQSFFNELVTRMKGAPGSVEVAFGVPPLGGFVSSRTIPPAAAFPGAELVENEVGARYFETFGIPIEEGRGTLASDDSLSPPVAVLNASAARIFFPAGGAVGKRFEFGAPGEPQPTIVGVVADFPQRDVAVRATPELFAAAAQRGGHPFTIAIRTSGDPVALAPFIRRAVHDLDPALAVGTVGTLERAVVASTAQARFASMLLAVFAALALTLAALGLYSVIAYCVARRGRELGIRAALGATGGSLVWLIAGEMLGVIGFGLAIGLAGAWLLSRVMQSLLYGTSVHDPLTFVIVPSAMLVTAAVATLLPARRAMRANPLDAIQAE